MHLKQKTWYELQFTLKSVEKWSFLFRNHYNFFSNLDKVRSQILSRPIKGKKYKAGRSYIGPTGPNVSGKGKSFVWNESFDSQLARETQITARRRKSCPAYHLILNKYNGIIGIGRVTKICHYLHYVIYERPHSTLYNALFSMRSITISFFSSVLSWEKWR